MFPLSKLLSLLLAVTMELGLSACGSTDSVQQAPDPVEPPAQAQETPEAPAASPEGELSATAGTEVYRGFLMDNVLHAPEGDIHYHIHIPDSYDGRESYALYLTDTSRL